MVLVDSKGLFTSLSTQRNYIDEPIRAELNFIWYEYENGNVDSIVGIPGKVNLTDPGTKMESPLTQPLIKTGELEIIIIDLSAS